MALANVSGRHIPLSELVIWLDDEVIVKGVIYSKMCSMTNGDYFDAESSSGCDHGTVVWPRVYQRGRDS